MITQCCQCKKILVGQSWRMFQRPVTPGEQARTTHTYCPPCHAAFSKEIQAAILERELNDPRVEVAGG